MAFLNTSPPRRGVTRQENGMISSPLGSHSPEKWHDLLPAREEITKESHRSPPCNPTKVKNSQPQILEAGCFYEKAVL